MTKRLSVKLLVVLSVFLLFAVFVAGCGNQEPYVPEITGVYASDIDIRYDGGAHSIGVSNTMDGDEIYYSLSELGPWRAQNPTYTMPGTYTVYYKVVREGRGDFIGNATINISRSVLSGIYADNAEYVYDGKPHGIDVRGLTDSESVLYSTDGENFLSELGLIEPGEYKVYYRVSNSYGDYFDDCTVSIFPNIAGTYVNFDSGIIFIDNNSATLNGVKYNMSYDVYGKGNIGESAFVADDDVFRLGDTEYKKTYGEFIYELTAGDKTVYAVGEDNAEIFIEFENGNAVVHIFDDSITVLNVNYCESISVGNAVRNYENNNLSVTVAAVERQTKIVIELSQRAQNRTELEPLTILYDGEPHSPTVEFDGEVFYKSGENYTADIPAFTDVGEYSVEVLLLSSEYLPERKTFTVSIIPDCTGVYYKENEVIEIDGFSATVNGESISFEYVGGEWVLGGMALTVTDTGISIGGAQYAVLGAEQHIIALIFGDTVKIYCDTINMELRVFETSVKTFIENNEVDSIDVSGEISIIVNGRKENGANEDGYTSYIIGMSEFGKRAVLYVGIECA